MQIVGEWVGLIIIILGSGVRVPPPLPISARSLEKMSVRRRSVTVKFTRSCWTGAQRKILEMTGLPESNNPRSTSEIASYHAHVYYNPATTRLEAERLRTWIDERFSVTLGRWHDVKVGPHDQAMFQVAFAADVFPVLVPWLMLNHGRLSILVLPNTTNPRRDHLADPFWIGPPLAVHGDRLPDEAVMEDAPPPNTQPHLRP